MSSARRLYWLSLVLGGLGLVAVILALTAALAAVSLVPPSVAELVAACRSFLLPDVSVGAVLVLSLASLGLAVLLLAGRAVVRQVAAYRRFMRDLHILGTTEIAGSVVTLVADRSPAAFCAGYLRPRIYLSIGARDALTPGELAAVVAHERHHMRRRDPLRTSVARTLAEALFFVPALRQVAARYTDLAELAADEAAMRERGAPTLASALLSFPTSGASTVAAGITPERADHLLGERPRWELSVLLVVGSLIAIGTLAGLAVQVALLTDTKLNLPTVLMQSCMLAMAAVPVLIAASGLYYSRAFRSARRRLA